MRGLVAVALAWASPAWAQQSALYVPDSTFAAEDVGTVASDEDQNDVVLRYNVRCIVDDATADLVRTEVRFTPVAAGASLVNTLLLRFPTAPAAVTLSDDGGETSASPCAGACGTQVTLYDDFRDGFVGTPTGFVNTDGAPLVDGRQHVVTVTWPAGTPTPTDGLGALTCPLPDFAIDRDELAAPIDRSTVLPANLQPLVGDFADHCPPLTTCTAADLVPWSIPAEHHAVSDVYGTPFLTWLEDRTTSGCAGTACAEADWYQHPVADYVGGAALADVAVLLPAPTCTDLSVNGDETGADCGGLVCGPCCAVGTDDCDLVKANGCEITTDTDHEHCGACGTACGGDEVCLAGGCVDPCVDQAVHTLTYSGTTVALTPPTGCNTLSVKAWGGGGGGRAGGTGGFAAGDIDVGPAETVRVLVAGGGGAMVVGPGYGGAGGYGGGGTGNYCNSSFYVGGGGGGYSGLFLGSVAHGNALLLAGGGGGSNTETDAWGGGGGGSTGVAARNSGICYPVVGAGGGTQNGGGQPSGIVAGNGSWYQGSAGGPLQGGNGAPCYNQWSGGGGGGGYYGGAGGNGDDGWNFCNYGGEGTAGSPGGGGSGYFHPGRVDAPLLVQGDKASNVPHATDDDYVPGVGIGATGLNQPGGNGLVVYRWSYRHPE